MRVYRSLQERLSDFDEDYGRLQSDCDARLEEMQRENDHLSQEVRCLDK